MNAIIHAISGDPRVKAYLASRDDLTTDGWVTHGDWVTYDGTPVEGADEVIVSAELADVDTICAAYKAAGVKVTVLGKQATE